MTPNRVTPVMATLMLPSAAEDADADADDEEPVPDAVEEPEVPEAEEEPEVPVAVADEPAALEPEPE